MRFAQHPVQVQILRQEHRRDHPDPVVHVARLTELAHSCIDDRESGAPFLPALEPVARARIIPLQPAPVGIEVGLQHLGVMMEHRHEKLAPGELFLKGEDRLPLPLRRRPGRRLGGAVINLSHRDRAVAEIGPKVGGRVGRRIVATLFVMRE